MASVPTPSQGDSASQSASHEPKLNAEQEQQAPSDHAPANHDQPIAAPVPQTPQTYLTFLLVSGRRRTMSFDPETTIGRVKELVWNAWPSGEHRRLLPFPSAIVNHDLACVEWQDERPPAPSYFRILHLGKILLDDDTLTSAYMFFVKLLHSFQCNIRLELSLPTSLPPQSPQPIDPAASSHKSPSEALSSPDPVSHAPPPHATIVHLSIRAYAPPADDDLKKDKGRKPKWGRNPTTTSNIVERGGGESTAGVVDSDSTTPRGCCGCIIC
ncbi:hypothetical protein EYR36_003176 [Pleurotus pulmonarius]|nr:hypothetical protein EYR36_003176 [Pleurotus pulmonarius]